mmetsp:Transcript_56106/g.182044  ORF Transcript_56106/g.182044 Transcript_56106/m.182044 type:complete len:86 (+) Transcript_56106:464-721(+)
MSRSRQRATRAAGSRRQPPAGNRPVRPCLGLVAPPCCASAGHRSLRRIGRGSSTVVAAEEEEEEEESQEGEEKQEQEQEHEQERE